MLKKTVIILGLLFVLGFFAITAAKISHQSSRSPAALPSSLVVPSQQEITKQAYDQGFNDALKSYDLMLKRPTHSQVLDFLATDNTSQLQSGDPLQPANCLALSTRFRDNALARGFWCYVVIFNWRSGSDYYGWHALNAFDTKDRGMIYIEPSGEKIVTLQLGDDYSKVFCSIGKFCPLNSMIVTQIGLVR